MPLARAQAQQVLTWARGEDRRRVEELIAELSDPRRLPADAACDAGHAPACLELVTPDPAGARVALEKACAAGETSACALLGSLLRRGEGGSQDLPRAEALLQSACDAGSGWGCGELGSLLLGRGTPTSMRDAAALYLRACEGDSPGSCAFLAQMHEIGRGVPRDSGRAKALYRKACDGGYAPACARAGDAARK